MCVFIVWYPHEFSRLHNLHPRYWNSLLYSLISSGENSAHFLQLMPFTCTILQLSFHQVPITAGWAEAVRNEKLAWHFYTWPAVGIEPQTFWSWVQCPIHWATCFQGVVCNPPGVSICFGNYANVDNTWAYYCQTIKIAAAAAAAQVGQTKWNFHCTDIVSIAAVKAQRGENNRSFTCKSFQ